MTCTICSKKQGIVVYEDSVCFVTIPNDAAVAGHMLVVPKQHFENLEELPEDIMLQLMYVASYTASAAYERLGCQGTNIFCNNGIDNHVTIHILPRKENDGLNFQWTPKPQQPADFDDTVKKIKDKTDYIGVKQEQPQEVIQESVEEPQESIEKKPTEIPKQEEDYMVKHLYRIP